MRRALLSVVLLVAALVLQLTVLDRLPLPGSVAPDLVLLVVVALALSSGPMPGMISGFCAGLALDIAPPAGHLIGVYALVFCLVGYFCGLVSAELGSSVLLPLAASALGAAGGAALYAAVGVILGNPDVTGSAVRHVLPLSVLYDVLLSPFVLYGVALCFRANSGRLALAHGRPAGVAVPSGEAVAGQSAALRPTALPTGHSPRIRAAAARPRDGWIGGGGWLTASATLARRQPATVRLHLGGQRTAVAPARTGTGGGRRLFTWRSRRSRTNGASWARFIRWPAWGYRSAGNAGSVPRRGSFSASTPRKGPGSAASPRRGTFRARPPRSRPTSTGSPRRGSLGSRSPGRGSLSSRSPGRGAFGGGPRTLRTLRKATRRGGSQGRARNALERVRGGRSSPWRRIGRNRGGGYR